MLRKLGSSKKADAQAEEGVASLWRGFGPYFLRGGGHTVGMFLFLEQYTTLVKNYLGRPS